MSDDAPVDEAVSDGLTAEERREKEIEEYLATKYFPPMYSAEEGTLFFVLLLFVCI